jgi:mitochondrial import receptor subunit TOM40
MISHLVGATYVGTKQFSPSEAFPVILGDIDPSGNLNANIIHQFSPNVRCKFASQVSITAVLYTDLINLIAISLKSDPTK